MADGLFDLDQLTAVATLTVSVCALGILAATLALARPDVIGSRAGWALVAASMAMLGARVLGHFVDAPWAQTLRAALGIAAAPLLPLGLWLVLRRRKEAAHGA